MTQPDAAEERSRLLGLHYEEWLRNHPDPADDPDDDLEYVAGAREIMGLPPLA